MRERFRSAAFREHHPLCVAVSLAFLVSATVFCFFYLVEPESVRKAVHHVMGHDSDTTHGISIPERERPVQPAEEDRMLPELGDPRHWFSSVNQPFHSAILIAGSNDYANYRHQADMCHAFQILKSLGVPLEQIITFIYDDIAHHSENPYPGQIFNRPGGENVYPGCAKDYRGWDVNKDTVLAVLRGDAAAVKGRGSGRVLKKDPRQRVFFFYTDHGSTGSIAMPVGPPIFADELQRVLHETVNRNHFKEMVIYLEACDAGSMFRGFHMERVLAVTAADAHESSYATYCPDLGYQTRYVVPNATYIGACLGDLFSVSWMEHTENIDVAEESLESQVIDVRSRTSNFDMYLYGSHVMTYGDIRRDIIRQVVGNFLSYFAAPPGWDQSDTKAYVAKKSQPKNHQNDDADDPPAKNYDQRSADLFFLYRKAMQNGEDDAVQQLEAEVTKRNQVDVFVRQVIQDLFDNNRLPPDGSVEDYATKEVFYRPERPVVEDWDCLRGMMQVFEENCVKLDDYSRQYARTFANFCNAGLTPSDILSSISTHCPFASTALDSTPMEFQ